MQELMFIDKYYPQSLDETIINKDIINNLRACSKSNNMPHLLISGPSGSCKKTLIDLFFKEKYGEHYNKNTAIVELKPKSPKKIQVKLIKSNHHIQINPSIHGVHDRLIIQEFINDIIKIQQKDKFMTIVIEDADKLANDSQESLRRTIEKYIDNCRFIFIQNSNTTIINPLESRSIKFTLGSPSNDDIKRILLNIVANENICISSEIIDRILFLSNRNIKTAINNLNIFSLEGSLLDDSYFHIENIFSIYKQDESIIESIPAFRTNINMLLTHCIDPIDICKNIFQYALNIIEESKIPLLVEEYANCCDNLKYHNKPTFHIEQFVLYIYILFL